MIPPQTNQQPFVLIRGKHVKTQGRSCKDDNHNFNYILFSHWLSPGPILALTAKLTDVPCVFGPHTSFARAVEEKLPLNGFPISFVEFRVK